MSMRPSLRLAFSLFEAGAAVSAPLAASPGVKTALVMHGLLGNKQNMRSMCRKLSGSNPNWLVSFANKYKKAVASNKCWHRRIICPDHRGHGDSPPMSDDAPHSLAGSLACQEWECGC